MLIGFLSSFATLQKLKMTESGALVGPSFEAQFNPTSLKHGFRNKYDETPPINGKGADLKFLNTAPETLSFNLILQKSIPKKGYGLALLLAERSVYDRVQDFLKLAYTMVGKDHEPREVDLSWGKFKFTGRLSSVEVNYTAFDNTGAPIRAELAVSFKGSMDDPIGSKSKSSPDLTHALTVKDWHSLPLITQEIYGDPHLYLLVAEANGLDHFRALKPGQKLHFPPTEKNGSDEYTD